MALPTPRQLLTSLFNTLTSYSPPSSPSTNPNLAAHQANSSETTNLFKSLPASHRALLTTLHVIIPPPTLLHALDLLDRRLVTRVSYSPQAQTQAQPEHQDQIQHQGEKEEQVGPSKAHVHLALSPSTDDPNETHGNKADEEGRPKSGKRRAKTQGFFLVRSGQVQRGRFKARDDRDSSGTSYIVRLEAWNCSCAAFAFSAFPSFGTWKTGDVAGDVAEDRDREEWEYGGESREGGGGVPVCKHLLACLLAERWGSVLGAFIGERVVEREEMAGLSAC